MLAVVVVMAMAIVVPMELVVLMDMVVVVVVTIDICKRASGAKLAKLERTKQNTRVALWW